MQTIGCFMASHTHWTNAEVLPTFLVSWEGGGGGGGGGGGEGGGGVYYLKCMEVAHGGEHLVSDHTGHGCLALLPTCHVAYL